MLSPSQYSHHHPQQVSVQQGLLDQPPPVSSTPVLRPHPCPLNPVSTQSHVKHYYCTANIILSLVETSVNRYFKLCLCSVYYPLAGTSDRPTTSGLSSTPSHPHSPPFSSAPYPPDSYVLPAAISVMAVLLVTVLTAIFGVVIYIITHRHETQKSLNMQRLSSIYYQNTKTDVMFKDKHAV